MSLKKIVLAYDASPSSKKAMDWAIKFAKSADASLHIMLVYDRSFQQMDLVNMTMDLEKTFIHKFQEEADAAAAYCREQGITVTCEVGDGNVADAIISKADELAAELIVCGTRGHGGFASMLLGSVAHALVTYAKQPVVVVK